MATSQKMEKKKKERREKKTDEKTGKTKARNNKQKWGEEGEKKAVRKPWSKIRETADSWDIIKTKPPTRA